MIKTEYLVATYYDILINLVKVKNMCRKIRLSEKEKYMHTDHNHVNIVIICIINKHPKRIWNEANAWV